MKLLLVMKRKLFSSLESYEIYANVEENMHVGAEAWMANCCVYRWCISLYSVYLQTNEDGISWNITIFQIILLTQNSVKTLL